MTHAMKILGAMLAALVISSVAGAYETNPYAAKSQEELAMIAKAQEDILNDLSAQLDELKAQQVTDPATLAAMKDVELTYYEAQTQQNRTIAALLRKQEDIFLYQDVASYTLLVMVVVITMAGIIFSAKELNRSVAVAPPVADPGKKEPDPTAREGEGAAPQPAPQPIPNNIKIGFSGIQITSALTGITVLTLSLAFLYLFLKEVYQIEAIRVPHIEDQTQAASGGK
ncbi:hypothetical protein [Kordiimonas aestuarii]|uniref:hypothetical protein n=1 Tax=Kordiimonas aestuarii TaxID=1005925 RepID=UPI0021D08A3B|nr:hypothetical protein [Kordiimonas aestuarii]